MTQTFIKDGLIQSFEIADGKVLITLQLGGVWVSNPTTEQLYEDGWKDYIVPTPEPILPTIEELVENKLREKYSINQEFEVQRKREIDKASFDAYYTYVEECIVWANEQPHREEE